jgi:flavin reductase (DIM6/NTAB) family NADH-FMN oxidoreductase RutF
MSMGTEVEEHVIDPRALRKALGGFVSGVTVVTTAIGDDVHGMTANAFTSVSLDPPLVLVSIARSAKMDARIQSSGRYGVSVLCSSQENLSLHFAGARLKAPETPEFEWRSGVPLVRGALVHLACSVYDSHPAGDHTLHIGRVEELWHRHGDPLVFFTGSFRALDIHQHQPELGF